tara:strand:+ start:39 stop:233 length:195 start_codon:yes stop_codon:yes gene_type:complete
MAKLIIYIPVTPGGTVCHWLSADNKAEAWENLFTDAGGIPYKNKQEFVDRGYKVEAYDAVVVKT